MQPSDYFESVRASLIAKREREIETLRALSLDDIPELPSCQIPSPNDFHPNEIFLSFPASFAVRDAAFAILEVAGWRKGNHFESPSAFYDDFDHPDKPFRLSLGFKSYVAGATCVCRQIATKEEPVYEWVCPEAAVEAVAI